MTNVKKSQQSFSQERLLDINEAATLLNLKISRIRSLVFNQNIPVIRIGRLLRFRAKDLNKWVSEKNAPLVAKKKDPQ